MTCFVWQKGCFDALDMHVCIAQNSQRDDASLFDVLPHSVCHALVASHHLLLHHSDTLQTGLSRASKEHF